MAGEPNPAATFVFRYKSNGKPALTPSSSHKHDADKSDALKRMLIIPRTPSPSPEPTEEPEADTTALDDELRALQTRMEEITVSMAAAQSPNRADHVPEAARADATTRQDQA